jgi:hypothetical protein
MKAVKSRVFPALAVVAVMIAVIWFAWDRAFEATIREARGTPGLSGGWKTMTEPARDGTAAEATAEQVAIRSPVRLRSAEPAVNVTSNAVEITSPPAAAKTGKEPLQDPMARVALAFVGADPEAEAYWLEAINDPSLPGHERSDLIEDLNEDGLSDPKQPTLEDLPLILNRLLLIQELAPNAMDQVNLDAFAEAYKDLLNLADVALGGGQPVR